MAQPPDRQPLKAPKASKPQTRPRTGARVAAVQALRIEEEDEDSHPEN